MHETGLFVLQLSSAELDVILPILRFIIYNNWIYEFPPAPCGIGDEVGEGVKVGLGVGVKVGVSVGVRVGVGAGGQSCVLQDSELFPPSKLLQSAPP